MGSEGAGYYPVIFGDLKGYRIVDRVGMSIERYLDSTTAATDTVKYFMRWRGGGKPTDGWRFVVNKCSV
jgi:HK97 family phage major capsid protein